MTNQEIRMEQYRNAALLEQVKVLKEAYKDAYALGYNDGENDRLKKEKEMLKHEFVQVLNNLKDKEIEHAKQQAIKNIAMYNGKHLDTALLEAIDNFVFILNNSLNDTQLESGAYIPRPRSICK